MLNERFAGSNAVLDARNTPGLCLWVSGQNINHSKTYLTIGKERTPCRKSVSLFQIGISHLLTHSFTLVPVLSLSGIIKALSQCYFHSLYVLKFCLLRFVFMYIFYLILDRDFLECKNLWLITFLCALYYFTWSLNIANIMFYCVSISYKFKVNKILKIILKIK